MPSVGSQLTRLRQVTASREAGSRFCKHTLTHISARAATARSVSCPHTLGIRPFLALSRGSYIPSLLCKPRSLKNGFLIGLAASAGAANPSERRPAAVTAAATSLNLMRFAPCRLRIPFRCSMLIQAVPPAYRPAFENLTKQGMTYGYESGMYERSRTSRKGTEWPDSRARGHGHGSGVQPVAVMCARNPPAASRPASLTSPRNSSGPRPGRRARGSDARRTFEPRRDHYDAINVRVASARVDAHAIGRAGDKPQPSPGVSPVNARCSVPAYHRASAGHYMPRGIRLSAHPLPTLQT